MDVKPTVQISPFTLFFLKLTFPRLGSGSADKVLEVQAWGLEFGLSQTRINQGVFTYVKISTPSVRWEMDSGQLAW